MTTGTPKAALLEHRGLCNVSHEQARSFGVGPGSRVLQFSSLSFDAATFDVVMALPKGGTLVLGEREELLPGPDLAGFLAPILATGYRGPLSLEIFNDGFRAAPPRQTAADGLREQTYRFAGRQDHRDDRLRRG